MLFSSQPLAPEAALLQSALVLGGGLIQAVLVLLASPAERLDRRAFRTGGGLSKPRRIRAPHRQRFAGNAADHAVCNRAPSVGRSAAVCARRQIARASSVCWKIPNSFANFWARYATTRDLPKSAGDQLDAIAGLLRGTTKAEAVELAELSGDLGVNLRDAVLAASMLSSGRLPNVHLLSKPRPGTVRRKSHRMAQPRLLALGRGDEPRDDARTAFRGRPRLLDSDDLGNRTSARFPNDVSARFRPHRRNLDRRSRRDVGAALVRGHEGSASGRRYRGGRGSVPHLQSQLRALYGSDHVVRGARAQHARPSGHDDDCRARSGYHRRRQPRDDRLSGVADVGAQAHARAPGRSSRRSARFGRRDFTSVRGAVGRSAAANRAGAHRGMAGTHDRRGLDRSKPPRAASSSHDRRRTRASDTGGNAALCACKPCARERARNAASAGVRRCLGPDSPMRSTTG